MSELDKTVGLNTAFLRGSITQEDLAKKMRERGYSWTKMTVYNIEKGERQLRYSEAYDMLACLGYDPIKDLPKLLMRGVDAYAINLTANLIRDLADLVEVCNSMRDDRQALEQFKKDHEKEIKSAFTSHDMNSVLALSKAGTVSNLVKPILDTGTPHGVGSEIKTKLEKLLKTFNYSGITVK